MKTYKITLIKTQLGWSCWWNYGCNTADQFTLEEREVWGGSRFLLGAFWNSWRAACADNRESRAKRGERASKGWTQ